MDKALLSFVKRYDMLRPGDKVVCALSGGADSVALTFALYLLKDKLGITLEAAHFNHRLRGEESQRDEDFVKAVINQESGFNPNATSHCGAMGLMQLMPSTAQGLGVKNAYDAEQNIEGGTKYLKGLMDRFGNDKKLALAAYNAGPNAVKKYNGIPPYQETQNYVKNVMSNYQAYKNAGGVNAN